MEQLPTVQSPNGITTAFGFRYVTLLVADISVMITQANQGGFKIAMPIQLLGNGAKIGMVEDPDGNIIEFVEEP